MLKDWQLLKRTPATIKIPQLLKKTEATLGGPQWQMTKRKPGSILFSNSNSIVSLHPISGDPPFFIFKCYSFILFFVDFTFACTAMFFVVITWLIGLLK